MAPYEANKSWKTAKICIFIISLASLNIRGQPQRAWREITTYHKKLIEVALPLEAISAASAREKSIRHGHPSTLHLWWSRKPLATCRAVLFASIVDDPSSHPKVFPTEEAQEKERQRLFRIIERLILWENTNNEQVLNEARMEILKATDGHPPRVLDPFCGGGSIPLEAQRLGLEAQASDLNPVAVLITKALIEIPSKFAGMPPVNPEARNKIQKKIQGQDWPGASGLAEDVRYYGKWMRDEAKKRIGHLYPTAKLPDGSEATVIAWLWARTVKCPNPACGAMMPLASKLWLSTKPGKEARVQPTVTRGENGVKIVFDVIKGQTGGAKDGTVNRRGARCLACSSPVSFDYIRSESRAKRLNSQLMAIVVEGKRSRDYLSPVPEHSQIAQELISSFKPDGEIADNPGHTNVYRYGLTTFGDLFSTRQLVALTTFSDLITEAKQQALRDADAAGLINDGKGIADSGKGAQAYSDGVATYLALMVDRLADYSSTVCSWNVPGEKMRNTFSLQAIPMIWDYAEVNPFSSSTGNFLGAMNWIVDVIKSISPKAIGCAKQYDSTSFIPDDPNSLISTDPPYYDNIGYADLSDFFYVWLKRSLSKIYPDIFSTLLVPKAKELVAVPYRFQGSKEEAKCFFENGLKSALSLIQKAHRSDYPLTIFYAYKQAENDTRDSGVASTGWEVMLESLITTRNTITGTWPIRTELSSRSVSLGSNALASSIVLVCRFRPEDAPISTRKEFISALKRELPEALRQLQKSNIAPVDLAQAAIGPGIAVFSRYSKVLEADGSLMRVRTALQLINQHLDEYLSEQEGEYDPDTRWALSWFEQYGMNDGPFGDADTLSKAKNTSVKGMVEAGILKAGAGKARLLLREEMDPSWDPATDRRLTVWEATQHLICTLEAKGETGASELQQKLGGYAQNARDLAYRLYSICERQGWAQEALVYNGLVTVWPRLSELHKEHEAQRDLESFNKKT